MLTRSHETFEKPGLVISYRLGPTPVFKGALVGVRPDGLAVPLNPAVANLRFIGVAGESVAAGVLVTEITRVLVNKAGTMVFRPAPSYAPQIADLGREMYAASDGTVQPTTFGLTNPVAVGTFVAIEPTGVRIRIDRHVN